MPSPVSDRCVLLLAMSLALLSSPALADGRLGIQYGNKYLDHASWQPVESQREMAFLMEFRRAGWPVAVIGHYAVAEAVDTVSLSDGIAMKVKGATSEIGLGIRNYMMDTRIQPFVEAGLMSVRGEMSVELSDGYFSGSASARDSAFGLWVGAGVNARISDYWSIGLLGRLSSADISLEGVKGDAGGKHISVYLTHQLD